MFDVTLLLDLGKNRTRKQKFKESGGGEGSKTVKVHTLRFFRIDNYANYIRVFNISMTLKQKNPDGQLKNVPQGPRSIRDTPRMPVSVL